MQSLGHRQISCLFVVKAFMLMSPSRFLLTSVLVFAAAIISFGQKTSSPKAVVRAFYKYDAANSQIFNRANIDARKRWLSSELYEKFLKELEREKAYLANSPTDKPHFGDGLPFRPLDETCSLNGREYRRTIAYGQVTTKGDLANVDVYFKYPKGCNIPDVLYAVNMSKERGRWVIGDIRYIAENTSLVEDLDRKEY
jgi:hypothetical protein